jgi:hypothetical protein
MYRMHRSRNLAPVSAAFVFLVVSAFLSPALNAQSAISTGAIQGRVEDISGALIPGVEVTITNTNTGLRQTTLSNEQGIFSFPALPVGTYRATATFAGFKAVEISGLNAAVGQTTAVSVRMEVGDVSQQVEVTASSEVLNTTDSHVSSVLGELFVFNLPSLRRNYTDFLLLTPTATTDGQFGDVSFAGSQGGAFSNYANSNASNAFTVDGANATSRYWGSQRGLTRIPYLFGAESVQEFQVSVNPYSPAYGGAATGFVNTVTKSGTNGFHGHAFYYNRDSAIGAIDAVSKAAGRAKAVDERHQGGAGVGGPIVRNKLFFFFNYEQQRRKNPASVVNPAQSAVNVTSFGLPAGTTLPTPTGYPTPGSLTTADASNPTYLQQASNALNSIKGNIGIRQRRQDDLVFFQKIDWNWSNKDRFSFSYNYNTFTSPGGTITASPVPTTGLSALSNNDVRDHSAVIHWVRTFGSSLVNDAHVSYSRDQQITTPSGLAPAGFQPSVRLTVPSTFTIGNSALSDLREYEWAFSNRLNYLTGRHSFEAGVHISRDSLVSLSLGGYNGTYTFSNLTAFALGQWTLFQQNSGTPLIRVKVPAYAFYAGDTIKVTRKLTLDLGVREDFQVYPQPELNPAIPLTGQFKNDYNRLAPRFGFAYHVLPRTVVRGGAGMFRAFLTVQNYINATTTNGLASQRSNLSLNYNSTLPPNAQAVVFPNILPSSSPLFAASANVTVVDPGYRNPSTLQSSLQIEQQLTSAMTATVGSIWVHGSHLISSSYFDLNLKRPTGTTQYIVCPDGTTVVPCAGYFVTLPNMDSGRLQEGAIDPKVGQIKALISPGNNNYISGFMQLRQQMRKGFSGNMSYTFSKNIASNGADFNDQFDFTNTKALALLDQRHRLAVGLVWQSQVLPGSRWKSALLSNWTFSMATQYGSGRPYAGILTPACIGTSLSSCIGGRGLNNTAFNYSQGIASAGPTPTVGLNSFAGPWNGSSDVSLERGFKIGESQKLMFRAQVFNALNHPNYYVQSGNAQNGVNQVHYRPLGPTCGNGTSENQVCYLIPNTGAGGFGTYSVVAQNLGPRLFQFAVNYRF